MTRTRPAAWLTAAVALFLLAVAGYAVLVHASPQYYWTQIDTAVYRDGGIAVRNQPAMVYALELGAVKLPFTYPPFAALLFAAGSGASYAIWQVGTLMPSCCRAGCCFSRRTAVTTGRQCALSRRQGKQPVRRSARMWTAAFREADTVSVCGTHGELRV